MRSAVASATAVAALPLGLIGLREHGRIAHVRLAKRWKMQIRSLRLGNTKSDVLATLGKV